MAKLNGFLQSSKPIHKTNNLLLRWFANYISSPIANLFLNKSLTIYFMDEDGVAPMTPWRKRKMHFYNSLYKYIGIPYDKWGTTYTIDMNFLEKEFEVDEIW